MSQDNIKQIHIQSRADWKENWEKENPILLNREVGYELDTGLYKIGDGERPWRALSYALGFVYNEENGEYIFNTQGINTNRISAEKIEGNEIIANSLYVNSININKPINLGDFTVNSTAPILSYDLNEFYDISVEAYADDFYNNELYPSDMPTENNWCPIFFYGAYDLPDGTSESVQGYIHELFADPNWDIQLSIQDDFLIQYYYEIAQSEIILTNNGWLYFEGGWQLDAGSMPFNIQVSYRGGN